MLTCFCPALSEIHVACTKSPYRFYFQYINGIVCCLQILQILQGIISLLYILQILLKNRFVNKVHTRLLLFYFTSSQWRVSWWCLVNTSSFGMTKLCTLPIWWFAALDKQFNTAYRLLFVCFYWLLVMEHASYLH